MRLRTLSVLTTAGFTRLSFARWSGPGSHPPVLCLHGLTRNGRDFDRLAGALSADRVVIAPDMPGRGRSQWLDDVTQYSYPTYIGVVAQLLAQLGAAEIDLVGTSMGGIIGMMLAAQKGTPIRRLVLNDIGPLIPASGLNLIGAYVGRDPHFATLAKLEAYLRLIHAPFGPIDAAGWRHMARHGSRRLPDGGVALAYDPKIADVFAQKLDDIDLWPIWDRIICPVLVVRGARSTLLSAETADEMARRGPRAACFTVPDAGHAPALVREAEVAAIRDFLTA